MKIHKVLLQVAIAICLSLFTVHYSLAQPTTIEVSGDITENTTWEDDTVKVMSNINVMDDITLTIDPGTYVEFQGWYCLEIRGSLHAVGEVNDTIVFTINDTTGFSNLDVDSGGWNGILFDNVSSDNDTSKLVCCKIEYGKALGIDIYDGAGQGGGISVNTSSKVLISHCNIYHNIAKGEGGGIKIFQANTILTHNLIHRNKGQFGGGVAVGFGSAIISNNIITKNISLGTGGGVFDTQSKSIISNNIITENISLSDGGGIHTDWARAKIDKNIISNNYCAGSGGGLSSYRSANTITCNLIVNNSADGGAGGCSFGNSTPVFHNNNVCNNSCPWDAGIFFHDFISADFMNNIIWGNIYTGSGSNEPLQIGIQDPSSNPNFYHCIIQGGSEGFSLQPGVSYSGDTINIIDLNPDFINPSAGPGLDFDGFSANWDIKNTSPSINQGTNEAIGVLPSATDLAGDRRVIYGQIDIGAYEKRISRDTATGIISKDTEWIADTMVITGDIKVADSMTLIIAPGTYLEFQGYYKMVIEGTIIAVGTEKDLIWFTINDTIGFAIDSINNGGWRGISFDNSLNGANGIMSDNDTSKIVYCIIEYAKDYDSLDLQGGAIKTNYYSNLVIKNCTIRHNSAYSGGGIGLMDGSDPLIEENIIYRNSAISNGGGISCDGRSEAKIINNIISNNFVKFGHKYQQFGGGGISCFVSDPVIQNNIISNNESVASGGGISLFDSYPLFANNTVCNNKDRSEWGGGGIHVRCNPLIYNTILWGNVNGIESLQVAGNDNPDFYYCNIQGGRSGIRYNWYDYQGKTIELNDTDPQFVSPSQGAGIEYDGLSADWTLTDFSPNINAGMPDVSEIDLPETDIAGNNRINYEFVDIGAYESQADPIQITIQPVNRIGCLGDTVEFLASTNVPATYQWQKDGVNIETAKDSILIINSISSGDEGNYHCVVANGYGNVSSNNVYLQVKQPPEILIQTESQWIKQDEPLKIEVFISGTPPLLFQWSKDGSILPGETSASFKIPKAGGSDEGVYTCEVTNSCASIATDPVIIYTAPQICMVTVDTLNGENKNLVVWEKNTSAPVLSYNIYRESHIAGDYSFIGSMPSEDLSVFLDEDADPRSQAYWYKITAVDTAGNESPLDACQPHKTIHLLVTLNPETGWIQLDWDNYIGFEYFTYDILSRNQTLSATDFETVHLMASSTSTWSVPTDLDLILYRVSVLRSGLCYPTGNLKADTGPYSHSMSNIEDNRLQVGIHEDFKILAYISIIPNPFNNSTTLEFDNPKGHSYTLYIMDLSGKICRIVDNITTSEYVLVKGDLKGGFYFLELRGPQIYRGKIVIE